ncbi:MAG: RluA family pseudouridine synthase [bacterium]
MNKSVIIIFSGEPQRLDAFLARTIPDLSRGVLKTLILNGKVTVNGILRKPAWPLSPGEKIRVDWPAAPGGADPLKPLIVYEDADILAVSKPPGLMIHPLSPAWEKAREAAFAGEPTLASMLLASRPEIVLSVLPRAGIVHRLDRGTSGIMLIAKTVRALRDLIGQFRERKVRKTYIGAVCGEVSEDEGLIEAPLGRATGSKRMRVSRYGRESFTGFRVLKRKPGYTLLELSPKTGRTNQLRVHLSWIGHPVVGDSLYGKAKTGRLMLHSLRVAFRHPSTGKKTACEVPLPGEFRKEWKKLSGMDIKQGGNNA